ncbi:Auxin-induced protein 5NG4 [Morus notabilis]|uniref:WAT1-related protein n=1 Tax=Morus notabilis TaxID=981085 RepID=W9SWM5_9ROSA|nr:Auxin-induced protein 5NG4 [Morus notabilis]
MGVTSWLKGLAPFLGMVIVEALIVGLNTLCKAAMSKGMNPFVYNVYSNALGTLIFLPFFIFQRTTVMQSCLFTGVNYSSPTLASALNNQVPAITFVLAVFFRMEKLDLRNSKSQIKIMGTLVSIAGALIVTIYKGPAIVDPQFQSTLNTSPSPKLSSHMNLTAANNWIIGGIFLTCANLSFAIWSTAQAAILKEYPSQRTILFFLYFFGTLQCAILALAMERDPSAWIITPDIELISVLYTAFFGCVVAYSIMTWCIDKKGPVFAVMFKPVGVAIAAFMSTLFLGDALYSGSIIGAFVIVIGFYGVVWAQSMEGKVENYGAVDEFQSPSSSPQTPLLESHRHV